MARELLERFLIGPELIAAEMKRTILTLLDQDDPDECRDDMLIHLLWLVGFSSDLRHIVNFLSDDERRRLARFAASFWKTKGTATAIALALRFFTGKPFVLRDYFFYQFISDITYIDLADLPNDPYVQSEFDESLFGIIVQDDGTINRDLLIDLLAETRLSSQRIGIIFALLVESFANATQWLLLPGATIEDGILHLDTTGGGDGAALCDINGADEWAYYTATAKVRVTTWPPGEIIGLAVHVTPPPSIDGTIVAMLSEETTPGSGAVSLAVFSGGSPSIITSVPWPIFKDIFYEVSIETRLVGANVECDVYVDGDKLIDSAIVAGANPDGSIILFVSDNVIGEVESVLAYDIEEAGPNGENVQWLSPKMILTPNGSEVSILGTIDFAVIANTAGIRFSLIQNQSGGSIDFGTGLYTAGGSAGTDIVRVVDGIGGEATAEVRVVP